MNPDWIETSMDEFVLSHAAKMPENLINVKEKDVSTQSLVTIVFVTVVYLSIVCPRRDSPKITAQHLHSMHGNGVLLRGGWGHFIKFS